MSESANKYKELKISELNRENNDLLAAAIKICSNAQWLKKHLDVGDDGEWDYKLNKALNAYKQDVEHLATIKIDDDLKNTYNGELTLERLVDQFEDFYGCVTAMSPLGEKEIEFVIAFGYLDREVKWRKEISLYSLAVVKPKPESERIEKRIIKSWHETPAGILLVAVASGLIVTFLTFVFGWV